MEDSKEDKKWSYYGSIFDDEETRKMKEWLHNENLEGKEWEEHRMIRPDYDSGDDDPVVYRHKREYDENGEKALRRKPINIAEAWANRPRGIPSDTFMMDTENWILQKWDSRKGIPQGPERYKNSEWAQLVQRYCWPYGDDLYWHEYISWVRSGGGDDWFQIEAPESV